MGLAEHGEWATSTGREPGPTKVLDALAAIKGKDRETFLSWLNDPTWPPNRVARAARRFGQAEAIPEMAAINHSNVTSWRASNGVKMNGS